MVTFKGSAVELKGEFPKVGTKAPSFSLVDQNLGELTLDTFKGKTVVLNIFVSLDTPVCSNSLKTFQKRLGANPNVVVANVSLDLPFAAKRYCEMEKMNSVVTLSAFRSTFPQDFGVEIVDGVLKGLMARAVVVISADGMVMYSELVDEISHEPAYSDVTLQG